MDATYSNDDLRRIARGVLVRAVEDATDPARMGVTGREWQAAVEWFAKPDALFKAWAGVADIDDAPLRATVLGLVRHGLDHGTFARFTVARRKAVADLIARFLDEQDLREVPSRAAAA